MRHAAIALFAAVILSVYALHSGAHRAVARMPLAPDPPAKSINLTEILTLNGPFSTFLTYLQQTGLVRVFQRQAHRTDHGITILVPVNRAFAAIDPSVLSGLSRQHLKELMLYHSLAKRYELADFEGLSRINPVTTFAGRAYTVNVTYAGGAIRLRSSWAEARIVGSVSVAAPMAVYELDRVLLPESLFPARLHVAEAPAPAPCNEEEASVLPKPEPYPVVPRVYGSAAGMADAPNSASCRPGAHQYVTCAAAAAFGALALVAL